jgi:integrase/recombinase XerD
MNYPVSQKHFDIAMSRKLPKYFNRDEINRILSCADNDRDMLLLNLLWRTGARISELLSINVSRDIDLMNGTIRVPTLKQKGRPERSIPIHREFASELSSYLSAHGITGKLFDISRQYAHRVVSETCQRAGMDQERSHPHTFRHSFAVFSVISRVPILVIKSWLGHSNIQSTLLYTKVFDQDTRKFYDEMRF